MRVHYNAPVVLTFSIAAVVIRLIDIPLEGAVTSAFFRVGPSFSFLDPLDYLRLVLHVLGHADLNHLFNNLVLLLLLGPILEERYGSQAMLKMMLVTAMTVGVINVVFFPTGLLGASSIVYMFITLISIVDLKRKSVPASFVIVAVLFLGNEILRSFEQNNISEMAHLVGGVLGAIFGFVLARVPAGTAFVEYNMQTVHVMGAPYDRSVARASSAHAPYLSPNNSLARLINSLFAKFWLFAGIIAAVIVLVGLVRVAAILDWGSEPYSVPTITARPVVVLPTASHDPTCKSFVVGGRARVVWSAANVRHTPGYLNKASTDVCDSARMGDYLEIVGGPEYRDDICWWKVKDRACGGQGWVAETRYTGDVILQSP